MATEVYSGPLGEVRAASTAGGGTALTTTAGLIVLPDGAKHVFLTPRNFSTAVVVKFALNPYLVVMKTADDLVTVTDYSQNAQDASTATDVTLSSLGTAAQADYVFVGAHLPFRGVTIDVDAANGTASVLTVKYWTGSAWTDISATDGTAAGGASLAQDGNVTWTMPTDWAKATLRAINSPSPGNVIYANTPLYWTRWQFSGGLDSSTTQNSWVALNRSTVYAELVSGQSFEERVNKGVGGFAAVEALTDAGTANLIVNVATRQGEDSGFV